VASKTWDELRLLTPPGNEVWELFHENSKTSLHDSFLSEEEIVRRMLEMEESLPYDQYLAIALPTDTPPLTLPLQQAIMDRVSARKLRRDTLRLEELGALLYLAYGVTRSNVGTNSPRAFRAAPSGGALYPLEIYLHSTHLEGQPAGLYHYNPIRNELRLLQERDLSVGIADGLVAFQRHLAFEASLILFLTAVFERSAFKYGTRGYRFVLLEAGHVAQNINLVATALGLACVNVGGYYDRRIDELLNLDGVTHSTVYMIALGEKAEKQSGGGLL
jgi:SagB-type dehydrogenase family enzyme